MRNIRKRNHQSQRNRKFTFLSDVSFISRVVSYTSLNSSGEYMRNIRERNHLSRHNRKFTLNCVQS